MKTSKPITFRLGLGSVIMGLDVPRNNPVISFKQNHKESYEVGTNLLIDGRKPSEDAEVTLEIVGLDGLIVLKEYIERIEAYHKSDLELLELFNSMDYLDNYIVGEK